MTLARRIQRSIADRYKRWRFRPHVIVREVAGERIRFFVGDIFGQEWYGPAHDLSSEYEWIKDHGIIPGDVVVDCGANHGFSTTLFSKWTGPKGRVHAFEPSAHNLEILRTNLRINGCENVNVCQAALGAEKGAVRLSVHPNATIQRQPKIDEPFHLAPLTRLDDELSGIRVDFMKIDVEGFELELLKGAEKLLADRPRLAIEVHVCMYQDKAAQLAELFELIPLEDYYVEIQPVTDGPIMPFEPRRDTLEALSSCHVVHLYCQ